MAPRVAVATSGGRDSTALLHCTLRQAAPLGVAVVALQVHHGLMADADRWQAQVERQARRWGAGFESRRVQGKPAAGDSVEAWARRARHRALAEMAQGAGCTLLLLAHHRRDQAETWLLQALRSGGPRGLSAMPLRAERYGVLWARPWLDLPRKIIESYVRRHRIAFVDDASNTDVRFARNRIRLQVWPALLQAFPHAEIALSGAARQAQQAARLAEETAAIDVPMVSDGTGLSVARWNALPPARRRNALQAWLSGLPGAWTEGVPGSLVDRLVLELPRARGRSRWPLPLGELHLHRGVLQQRRD